MLAVWVWVSCALISAKAEDSNVPPPEPPPVPVHLTLDPVTRLWKVQVDGKQALAGNEFKQSPAAVSREGVRFETDEERLFLKIGPAAGRGMEIKVDGFPDWVVAVPTNNQCAFRVNEVQRLVDLTSPKENSTNLTVRFPDGGVAEMGSASFARYDVMDDTSYYFSGQGKVDATEADGVKKRLSPLGYPMMGGPLTEYTDDKGRRRWRRIIPPVAFGISGEIRRKISIATDSATITLEAGKSAVLEMQNGAVVSFTHDPANGWLRWHVQKGYAHFHIPEVRCWRAMALTDQDGAIQWNPDAHAVDVHNSTSMDIHPPNRFVVAALSHSMTGAVGPRNILQYLQLEECRKFSVGGIGNEVYVYDTDKNITTPIANVNMLVQLPQPNGGVPGTPDTQVTSGANGTKIIRTRGVSVAVAPGTDRTLTTPDGQVLSISVSPEGEITMTALTGDHTFGMGALGDWTFTVKEGDTFILKPSSRRDLFIVQADRDNTFPIDVLSPDGHRPELPSDSSLTFVTGDSQTTVERGDQLLVFFDNGEGSGSLPFGMAEVSPPNMDARGTPQPFGRLVDYNDPTQVVPPGVIPPVIVVPPASVVGGP